MNTLDVQRRLKALGWPIRVDNHYGPQTRFAVRCFQQGFAYRGPIGNLTVDGKVGPRTAAALRWSAARRGGASRNFTFSEFASKGNGWILVDRRFIRGLQAYRKRVGHGVNIVSAYRDPKHNDNVGGAKNSQHLYGFAADLIPELTVSEVRQLGVFSGIGYQGSGPYAGKVRHVDMRHLSGHGDGGTPSYPTTWAY